jgi:site-specific recombinase XerD
MAVKWIKTTFRGVRYHEHETRKHGVKKDQYFTIRYALGDKVNRADYNIKEEGLGWASQGWTAAKAYDRLRELKENHKIGQGPQSLAEKRELERKRKEAEAAELERQEKENITLNDYFYKSYYPDAKINKKEDSYIHEETHFRLWIDPICGNKPIKGLSEFDARRIVKKLFDHNKTPRTAQYVMATLRQVWNKARRDKRVTGDSPTRNVKIPKFDNRRQRFLSHVEADLLLDTLEKKDKTIYKMTLLSLHTGMRASEIFKLTWGCIDTERGIITILDAKSGHGRTAFMTKQIKEMFCGMKREKNDDFVFMQRKGIPYKEIPTLFRDIITELKLNENVSDSRQRVCFHTLRHTMASWHAEGGTDLYILKELLGHGSITLTERYSHLSNGTLQEATRSFEKKVKAASKKAGEIVNFQPRQEGAPEVRPQPGHTALKQ